MHEGIARRLVLSAFIITAVFAHVFAPVPAADAESEDAYERLLEKYPGVMDGLNEEEIPEEGAVVELPSRFSQPGGALQPPADDASSMVAQWLADTGGLSRTKGDGTGYQAQDRLTKSFAFGIERAHVLCRPGMITDVELEPGERVENYVVSDPDRWSISAAWSGNLDDLVTHVLLRTLFPGLKTNVMIYTDRRAYSLSVESSETGQHTSRVAFNYLAPKDMAAEIPPGEWRDLLEQYDLLPEGSKDSGLAKRRTGSQNLIDGADIYFHYIIRQSSGSAGRRIDWIPVAVYDANGRTYIALPQKMTPRPGAHSLRIKRGDRDLPGTYKVLKDNLYVVDRLFDFGILSFGGNSVEIRRADPASEN